MPRLTIPEDRINLRLILVSGKTKDFLFRPSDSAGDIAQYVFDHWPQGKVLEGQSDGEKVIILAPLMA